MREGLHLEGVRVEHGGLVGEVGAAASQELAGQRRLPGARTDRTGAPRTPSARAIAAACGMRDPAPRRTAARLIGADQGVKHRRRVRAGGVDGLVDVVAASETRSARTSRAWSRASSVSNSSGQPTAEHVDRQGRRASGGTGQDGACRSRRRCTGATGAGVRRVAHPAAAAARAAAVGLREAREPQTRRLPWQSRPGRRHCPSVAVSGSTCVPPAARAADAGAAVAPGALFVGDARVARGARSRGALEGVGAADLLLARRWCHRCWRGVQPETPVGVGRSGDEAGSGPGATGDGGAADQDLASVHPELRTLSAGGAAASVAVEPVVTHLLTNPQ